MKGRDVAIALISYEEGTITPYGVVYDNGMEMARLYDGKHLPEYFYDDSIATVTLSLREQPHHCETLYFPCADSKIDRALRRLGVKEPSQCSAVLGLNTGQICDAVRSI